MSTRPFDSALAGYEWVGPYRLRDYLNTVTDVSHTWPPQDTTNSIYIASVRPWCRIPIKDARFLWVGGSRDDSSCIFDRVSGFVIESLGFFGGRNSYRSIGGQKVYRWCQENGTNPLELFLAWAVNVPCRRCAERNAIMALEPTCNKNAPPRCKDHP